MTPRCLVAPGLTSAAITHPAMAAEILALSNLLQECQKGPEDVEEEEEEPRTTAPAGALVTPGSFGPPKQAVQATDKTKNSGICKNDNNIWEEEEVVEAEEIYDPNDKRPAPKFDFYYKQLVGTEDVFLGTSDKTPSSNDCTHLVVKVHFPGCTLRDLDLDVTKRKIKAESPTLRLSTYLPLPVDHEKGSAKFDKVKELLVVTLPILVDEL